MRMGIHWHRLSKSHDYEDVTGRIVRTLSADCARIATIVILCRNLLAFCYVVKVLFGTAKLVQFYFKLESYFILFLNLDPLFSIFSLRAVTELSTRPM